MKEIEYYVGEIYDSTKTRLEYFVIKNNKNYGNKNEENLLISDSPESLAHLILKTYGHQDKSNVIFSDELIGLHTIKGIEKEIQHRPISKHFNKIPEFYELLKENYLIK